MVVEEVGERDVGEKSWMPTPGREQGLAEAAKADRPIFTHPTLPNPVESRKHAIYISFIFIILASEFQEQYSTRNQFESHREWIYAVFHDSSVLLSAPAPSTFL